MADGTSVYANINAPYNPLKTLGDVASVRNALQSGDNLQEQNQLLQTRNSRENVGLDADKTALALTHYNNIQTMLAPLATDENLTQSKMQKTLADAVGSHMISPEDAVTEMSNWGSDTPENNNRTILNHLIRAQTAADQIKQIAGQNYQINNGSTITQGVLSSPIMGGGFSPSSSQPIELTPGEQAARVPVVINKVPTTVPQSDLSTPTGMPKDNVINGGGQASNGDTSSSEINPHALQTGYAPGDREAADVMGQTAGTKFANDKNALTDAPSTLYQMEEAGRALQRAPTGKGTQSINAIKSYATAFAPKVFKNTDWENDVEAYDKATKYLSRQAQTMGNQVGPHTNTGLATAITGSPNTDMNNLTAQQVQAAITGLTRLNLARTADFLAKNPSGSAQDYQNYGPVFNKNIDVKGFMLDLLPKDKAAKILKDAGPSILPNGQSNPVRQRIDNAYNLATKYNLMDDVTQGQNGQ